MTSPELPTERPTNRIPLYGTDFSTDPAKVYEELRQYGPTAPVELAPDVAATLVTSYETALEVLRNPSTFPKNPSRWQENISPDCPVLPMMGYRPNCLFNDGEVHARLRGAITDSLARVDTNALREYIERSADELIAKIAPAGKADLLGEFAALLPLLVFNHMFGCPPELAGNLVKGMRGIFDGEGEPANTLLTNTLIELVGYKREHPGEDVTTWLLEHPAKLADEEMVHQLAVLMGAGTEPEQNLIANGLRLLLSDERFAGDLSGGNLPVEDALDEVLWADPPMANFGTTFPVEDIDFAGVRLPANQPVVISFAAANNDPTLASQHREGNRAHLAWSAGPHACPAQGQARLIASVAIEKILDGLPDMELAVPVEALEWRPGPFHRALASLPVRFPPVSVPVHTDEKMSGGDSKWKASPSPSSSTQPAETSTPKQPLSANAAPRRWWSFLVRWWRGQ